MKRISRNKRIFMILAAGILLLSAGVLVVGNSYARHMNEIRNWTVYPSEYQYIQDFAVNAEEIAPYTAPVVEPEEPTPEEPAPDEPSTDEPSAEDPGTEEQPGESENLEEATPTEEENVPLDNEETTTTTPEDDTITPPEVTLNGTVTCAQYPTENSPLLLEIVYPEGSTQALINSGEGLPIGTSYSYNGIDGFKLNASGAIEIVKGVLDTTYVLMIFPDEFLDSTDSKIITIDFIDAAAQSIQQIELELILLQQDLMEITLREVAPRLGEMGSLTWNITSNLSEVTKINYTVMCNSLTTAGYQDYILGENILMAQTMEESTTVVNLSQPEGKKETAGTYQLVIIQEYTPQEGAEKIQLQKAVVPFFVNYR